MTATQAERLIALAKEWTNAHAVSRGAQTHSAQIQDKQAREKFEDAVLALVTSA